MTPSDLIAEAEAAGIRLTPVADRVEFDAPDTETANRLLALVAAQRAAVHAALLVRRADAVARRLVAEGVDQDLADEMSERVAIEVEFLSPLLAGASLIACRPIRDEDGP